ncbi:hypothetical protein VCHA51O444_10446 [Vibrio chagasii]|nr:hypothetical protein VCHA51O444_10446 [Vibrio chagasii]CAH7342358.1 hypothetical protein VCHA53O474_30255 [Vibrio chagasii]
MNPSAHLERFAFVKSVKLLQFILIEVFTLGIKGLYLKETSYGNIQFFYIYPHAVVCRYCVYFSMAWLLRR